MSPKKPPHSRAKKSAAPAPLQNDLIRSPAYRFAKADRKKRSFLSDEGGRTPRCSILPRRMLSKSGQLSIRKNPIVNNFGLAEAGPPMRPRYMSHTGSQKLGKEIAYSRRNCFSVRTVPSFQQSALKQHADFCYV